MVRRRRPLPSCTLDDGFRNRFLDRPHRYLPESKASLFVGDLHLAIRPLFQNDFPGCCLILDLVQRSLMNDRVVVPDHMLGSDAQDAFQLSCSGPHMKVLPLGRLLLKALVQVF
jgi:hypothetical protein